MELKNFTLGNIHKVENVIFIGCTFKNVMLRLPNLVNVTFVNCKFFNCETIGLPEKQNVQSLGCFSEPQEFLTIIFGQEIDEVEDDSVSLASQEIYVLEKFWPKGRPTFSKHRPIKGICSSTQNFSQSEILEAISALKKRKYLLQPDKISFLELNIDYIPEIKKQLGRT